MDSFGMKSMVFYQQWSEIKLWTKQYKSVKSNIGLKFIPLAEQGYFSAPLLNFILNFQKSSERMVH